MFTLDQFLALAKEINHLKDITTDLKSDLAFSQEDVMQLRKTVEAYALLIRNLEAEVNRLKLVQMIKPESPNAQWSELERVWKEVGKLACIKLYREYYQCGLREAKDAVEKRFANIPYNGQVL